VSIFYYDNIIKLYTIYSVDQKLFVLPIVSRRLSSHTNQLSVQPKNLDCQEASSSKFTIIYGYNDIITMS